MYIPWTTKYRPRKISEIAGNLDSVSALFNWVKSWDKKVPSKKALLLHGPAGTGKTVSVEALANEYGYDLIEINASDSRTGDAIRRIAGMAAGQATLFGKKRIVLLDEIDGINLGEDTGAIDAIVETIEKTNYPVVLTANNAWDQKIRYLRDVCQLVEYKRLGVRDALPYLKRIAAKEGIEIDEKALKLIIERDVGDMQSIINDLQALSSGRKKLAYDDVAWLAWRDRKENIFEALGMIFSAKNCLWAKKAIDIADIDYEMLFEWIYENAPRQLTDPLDRANAMEYLAKADIYLRRVKGRQAWDLLAYFFDLMTAGVALSRERTRPSFVPMKFPERISLLSRTRRIRGTRARVGAKIGRRCHVSSISAVKYYLPYLRIIFENDYQAAAELSRYFGFDEEDITYLAGDESSTRKIERIYMRLTS
jgi:replication factor C large subunit